MRDDEFEWDDAKAAANLAKHTVSFEDARSVFADINSVDELDDIDDSGEQRYRLTGIAFGEVIVVIYCDREDRRRIISARKGSKREQKNYFAQARRR